MYQFVQKNKYIINTGNEKSQSLLVKQNEINRQNIMIDERIQVPFLKIYCILCEKDISNQVCITSSSIYYCVACFTNLSPYPDQYRVLSKVNYPIMQSDWNAYAEILLLHSLEKWKYGNWKEIKNQFYYFGYNYSQNEIQRHYNTFYLVNFQSYLPKISEKLITKKKQQILQHEFMNSSILNSMTEITSYRDQCNIYFSDTHQYQRKKQNLKSFKKNSEIECDENLQDKFEVVYDDKAEQMLINLEFRDDQNPEEHQLKLKILQQYNKIIQKRYKIQNNIVKNQQLNTKKSHEFLSEKGQVICKMKQISKFLSAKQYNRMINKLVIAKQLQEMIESLRHFRKINKNSWMSQIPSFIKKQNENMGKPRKIVHLNSNQGNNKNCQLNSICHKDDFKIIKDNLSKNGEKFTYKEIQAFIVPK